MILNYSVTLSDWRSTTASSETPPLFMTVGQSVCLTDWLTDWLKVWLSDQMTPSSTFQQAKRLHNSFVVLNTSYFIENIFLILQAWIRCWRNLQTGQSCYQWAHQNGLRWPVYSTGENYPHATPQLMSMANKCFSRIWSVCRWWRYFGSRGRAEYSELLCESLLSHERSMRLRCMMLTYCLVHACLKSHREYVSSETYLWTRYQKLVKHLCCQ